VGSLLSLVLPYLNILFLPEAAEAAAVVLEEVVVLEVI
jgi:hypothetical protein